MMRKKRDLTPEQRAALREALGDVRSELAAIRERFERRLAVLAEWEAAEARRRERLRRLTLGLLGGS
jgi:hypothetical protein